MRCAAIGARTIEIFASHSQVIGAPLSGLHKDKMGEFRMISATEVNGKPVYEKEPSISHMVWASNGYWYVGRPTSLPCMHVLTTAPCLSPQVRGPGGGCGQGAGMALL